VINDIAEELIRRWFAAFKNKRWTTTVATLLGAVASLVAAVALDHFDKQRRTDLLESSPTYEQQIERLQQTEMNVKQLLTFVENEKKRLHESEDLLASMKAEHERLSPIVESDRKVVEAVLGAQAQQQARGVWRERWIGFALGVAASMIASFVFALITLAYRKAMIKRAAVNAPVTT
jgi:mannitol-specific phosphotransferase system IIBC component